MNLRKQSQGTVLDVLVNLNFKYRNTGFLREDIEDDFTTSEVQIFPILANVDIIKKWKLLSPLGSELWQDFDSVPSLP